MAQVAERVNWLGLGPQENYPDRHIRRGLA
ncbi:hypothetical protein [Klebsiella pneumoniae]